MGRSAADAPFADKAADALLAGLGDRAFAPSAALRVMFAALACSLSRFALRRCWAAFSFSDILGWKACLPRRATAEPTFTATAVGLHPLLRGGELVLTSLTVGGGVWRMTGVGVLLRAEAFPRGPEVLPVELLRDEVRRRAGVGCDTAFPPSAGFGGMLIH